MPQQAVGQRDPVLDGVVQFVIEHMMRVTAQVLGVVHRHVDLSQQGVDVDVALGIHRDGGGGRVWA